MAVRDLCLYDSPKTGGSLIDQSEDCYPLKAPVSSHSYVHFIVLISTVVTQLT
jgi:hypothetical protein